MKTKSTIAFAAATLAAISATAAIVLLIEGDRKLRESFHGGRLGQYVVTNDSGRIPAINRALAVRYAWADPGAPPSSVQYAEAAMARAGATNGLDIYEARVPCELREEFRHVVECRFEGYYLISPAENGMASPAILYAGGRTNDPVAAAAAPAVARPWGAVLSGTPTLTVAGGAQPPAEEE